MNCKFVVIATVWSEEEKKQVKVICGMFAKFVDAVLFTQAYSEFYKTATEIKKWIVCACKLDNKNIKKHQKILYFYNNLWYNIYINKRKARKRKW